MHYYQHHIGDFIKDTSFLTNEEIGIYMKLIWLYYDTEQPLPDDVFTLSMKSASRGNEEMMLGILNMFFKLKDGFWHHNRCDQEIAEFHEFIESKSRAGKASAERRLNKKATGVEQVLNKRTTDEQLTTTHKPLPTNHIKNSTPNGFDLFWNAYNKKVGKPNSIKQWQKINPSEENIKFIVSKALADSEAKPDNKFRKDPERWLKGQHWLDEIIVSHETTKELPLGTEQQIEAAYRAECGDPAKSRFQSYYEMRNYIVAQREKRKNA